MKVRTDAKRDAILKIAAEVFLEMGYERTSMAAISARVGGSKATLYGYFASKEAIFLTLAHQFGAEHIDPAMEELTTSKDDDIAPLLQRFGECLLAFLAANSTIAAHRAVLAEAGHSDAGRLFYEAGQQQGLQTMAAYLQSAMDRGLLRQADPLVAARHFGALMDSEIDHRYFYRENPELSPAQITGMAERAVQVFMGGYGPRQK
jgi:AcrR family transcriptional regulator